MLKTSFLPSCLRFRAIEEGQPRKAGSACVINLPRRPCLPCPGCGHQASVTTGTIVEDTCSLCGCGFGPRGAWPPKRTAPAPWVCNGLPGLRDYEKDRTWARKVPPCDGRSGFARWGRTVEVAATYLTRPRGSARDGHS